MGKTDERVTHHSVRSTEQVTNARSYTYFLPYSCATCLFGHFSLTVTFSYRCCNVITATATAFLTPQSARSDKFSYSRVSAVTYCQHFNRHRRSPLTADLFTEHTLQYFFVSLLFTAQFANKGKRTGYASRQCSIQHTITANNLPVCFVMVQ